MSAIYIDNRLVHYEVFGRGQPIIFLHTWFGSWRYWVPTMDRAAERYRAYALDFWGFGDSERQGNRFDIPAYVDMLIKFMDQIGLQKANLVGHGLGGMVAIRAAIEHHGRFLKLLTVSTPLHGAIINDVLKQGTFSRPWGRSNPTTVWSKLINKIPIDDPEVRQEIYDDTESLSEQVVHAVQEAIIGSDLRPSMAELEQVPLLAVYGDRDQIVPHSHAQLLNESNGRPHQMIVLPRANHFPFLDERSDTFNRLLMDFLVSEGSPVEIKENWRRRVSQREYI